MFFVCFPSLSLSRSLHVFDLWMCGSMSMCCVVFLLLLLLVIVVLRTIFFSGPVSTAPSNQKWTIFSNSFSFQFFNRIFPGSIFNTCKWPKYMWKIVFHTVWGCKVKYWLSTFSNRGDSICVELVLLGTLRKTRRRSPKTKMHFPNCSLYIFGTQWLSPLASI